MGAGTDAARDASAAASPNVNLTEGGLRSILERTKATNTGFLSFLEANKNYETNRGSDHANVNHTQFKNAWGQNYDTNYFMVKNINRSNMSDAEKQLAKQKLFKNYSEEQLQEYKQKAINLKRLERGDYQ